MFINGKYKSIIFDTDSYKASHYLQYPPEVKYVSSYVEARWTDEPFESNTHETVFFGLQMFLERLQERITKEAIEEADEIFTAHGEPFNRAGWMHILRKYDGKLPVEIQAVAEGTVMPLRNVQVQIRNTRDKAWWLTSYLETALLRSVWYPSTVATLSRETKKIIYRNLLQTCDDPDSQVMFKLHDFGARGATCREAAMVGGVGHLVNFLGTDTVGALIAAKRFYGCAMAGFSIPAAEHSTITSWGHNREVDAYRNMLTQFGGEGKLVAVVSDSYDIYNACEHIWGEVLKDEVTGMKGTLVVRPDSGDPVEVTAKVIEILGAKFGFTINSKGFKVLNPAVRIIQGDGVTPRTIEKILDNYQKMGWSGENIAFGMGGGLLQKVNRDSLGYAMKANAISTDGIHWIDVWKKPITDSGKVSKSGRLALVQDDIVDTLMTVREDELNGSENHLMPVFRDGEILKQWTFEEVRKRAAL